MERIADRGTMIAGILLSKCYDYFFLKSRGKLPYRNVRSQKEEKWRKSRQIRKTLSKAWSKAQAIRSVPRGILGTPAEQQLLTKLIERMTLCDSLKLCPFRQTSWKAALVSVSLESLHLRLEPDKAISDYFRLIVT